MASILAAVAMAPGSGRGTADARSYDGSSGDISVQTPAVDDAKIRIDGRFDEPAWDLAALLRSFTQYQPVEGVPASQKTEVRVLVDRSNIYFAIKAFDDNPSGIRATMAERDAFGRSDDYVRIILDTFDDQRRGYVFSVNPLGVQQDGIWNEGGGSSSGRRHGFGPPVDDNPDYLWESHGEVTNWGYAVEIRIPFKSLRFPAKESQAWGLQIIRRIQRTGFESSWAPISSNVSNKLAQAGTLTNLMNLSPGMMLEINPVTTGKRLGSYDEDLASLRHTDPNGDFGLNLTYGITSNLTLDATYNPDFSQVEADAGQIAVNERFALFFPEKRPFFLEGTEIFGMAKQLVYTRSIANPIAGAKLTGKVGNLNLGYIGAIDESMDGGSNTAVNLIRLRRDVGAQSTLGAVYTDRTVAGNNYNRVAGADARLVFARRYTLTVLGASSRTRAPDEPDASVGSLMSAKFERASRTFSFSGEIEDTNRNFDAGSGFFRRVGDTQVQTRAGYNWFGRRGALLEQMAPSLEFQGYWDHDAFWAGGGLEESKLQLSYRMSFRNNITLWSSASRQMFAYEPAAYEGLFVDEGGGAVSPFRPDPSLFNGLDGVTVGLWFNNWERVRGNVRATWGEQPIFDRSYRVPVAPANSFNGDVSLNLFPTRSLKMELGLRHTRLTRKQDGSEYSSATIPRIRAQYQFSRSFFVRGIVEYSAQETRSLHDPVRGRPLVSCGDTCDPRAGSEGNDFHVEGLVTYEPSPGTVFYIGYTRDMKDTGAFRFRNVRATADGLFVKLSYRFRM